MDKITSVSMAVSAQQDKNHATFQIECEGEMHQLRAQHEAEMKRFALHILPHPPTSFKSIHD